MNATQDSLITRSRSREDLVVVGVLAVVGVLGIAVGVVAPERTVEPSLGLLLLIGVIATFISERRRRGDATR